MNIPSQTKIHVRHLTIDDYDDIHDVMVRAYAAIGGHPWQKPQIERLLELFPAGQIGVEVNGRVVGAVLTLIVDYKKFGDSHTYRQITGNHSFDTHDPNGDVLYGIDIFIDPDFRGLRLGRRLYDARKELCEKLNLSAIVAGGRIPGFAKYASLMTPKEYIEKVRQRELYDPILTFQFSNGFHVKKVLQQYLEIDTESKSYATLIQWHNIYYEPHEQLLNAKPSVVRLGLVQWQMRTTTSLDAMREQIEFFVDAVSDYRADFILFPEFFSAPLMAKYNHLQEHEAIRCLASHTSELIGTMSDFAVSYNVNIITGSMPVIRGERLFNTTWLCRRDGSREEYDKLHITPSEASAWGMTGGNRLGIFDTDCGKIGIAICYDVEFPELCRLYAEQGVQILFVPFLTDTQNGYNRVRRCAQARAVENECYVAIAGCVGNLPRVNNMDIQYAQSAVFSPSDFSFPTSAVVSEATPNTEMMLISDINLDLLIDLHQNGSVRNLKDRRTDLYGLKWK